MNKEFSNSSIFGISFKALTYTKDWETRKGAAKNKIKLYNGKILSITINRYLNIWLTDLVDKHLFKVNKKICLQKGVDTILCHFVKFEQVLLTVNYNT